KDAQAWYRLAMVCTDNPEEHTKYLERAVGLDPYLKSAIYALGQSLRQNNPERSRQLMEEFEALQKCLWYTGPQSAFRYSEMGYHASVIDRFPRKDASIRTGPIPTFVRNDNFKVRLRPGSRWATSADFGKGPVADLRR